VNSVYLKLSDGRHLNRIMQQIMKMQMMMNASKMQTVRLRNPAGV